MDAVNNSQWTPLNFAAEYGHEAVVDLLLAAGDKFQQFGTILETEVQSIGLDLLIILLQILEHRGC